MFDGAYVYILLCADGSYYTGTARQGLEQRVAEHNAGHYGGYTATRRPVHLVILAMVRADRGRNRSGTPDQGRAPKKKL
jgi:predicted GIY-YIG superfamily endonuclease